MWPGGQHLKVGSLNHMGCSLDTLKQFQMGRASHAESEGCWFNSSKWHFSKSTKSQVHHRECKMGNLVPAACHKTSISPKIIPLCQAGLEEWKSSFMNGVFGQWQACGVNVTVLNVKLARWIAAAGVLYFPSLILWLINHILKSTSLWEVTFVTSTQNYIVN